MCGIAGFSLAPDSALDRTLVAQALLAGIAERGAHAVGYAVASSDRPVVVEKRQAGASALLDHVAVGPDADHVLIHVRDFTKGHPSIEANNHPIRHGTVVGIHNGVIENDDLLFDLHGWTRETPETTVDSEVIFAAIMHRNASPARALEELRGTMATAWVDEREQEVLNVARGARRPLWIATGKRELLFASTRSALCVAARYARVPLRMREVREGTLLTVVEGRIARRERFRPDRRAPREHVLASRAPSERAVCLERLAVIAGV
jgi:glucosamine 6-phosphate synthetase-like amidotransferase/phosphosugar isomerase protein